MDINNKRGFTLVEILTAMVIIVILATIILITGGFGSPKKNARRAKTLDNVNQIRLGFIFAQQNNQELPGSGGGYVCISNECTGAWASYPVSSTVRNYVIPYLHSEGVLIDASAGFKTTSGYLYNKNFGGSGIHRGAYLFWTLEETTSSPDNPCGENGLEVSVSTVDACAVLLGEN